MKMILSHEFLTKKSQMRQAAMLVQKTAILWTEKMHQRKLQIKILGVFQLSLNFLATKNDKKTQMIKLALIKKWSNQNN